MSTNTAKPLDSELLRPLASDGSIVYYDRNAAEYAKCSLGIDMEALYDRFLDGIPVGGRIVDVGCGAGRDLRAFIDRGYAAEGIEPAARLAQIARVHSNALVTVGSIETLPLLGTYDGIWACASLLHVEAQRIPMVLHKLVQALSQGGKLFTCFKSAPGLQERIAADGRYFVDLDLEHLEELIATLPDVKSYRCWTSKDGGGRPVTWSNAELVRS